MNIPIFLSSDNNYAPFVATTMASVLANTKSNIDFYVLDSGIPPENKAKIETLKTKFNNFSLEFIEINTEKEFSKINYKNSFHITLATYNRFLIPKLKPELEKAIYLDVDVIVLKDIKELFEEDLDGFALGACWDESRKAHGEDSKDLMEFSKNYKYFNAGVLLIDIQKWLKGDIASKLMEIYQKYQDKVLHADETLLNKYFDSNYKVLSIRYNFREYDYERSSDVVIRHFATELKPWYDLPEKAIIEGAQDFWRYAEMTEFYNHIVEKFALNPKYKQKTMKYRVYNLLKNKAKSDVVKLK